MDVVSLVLMVVGVGIGLVGVLGFLERLPRNRFAGVRTPATLRSDRAFVVANKVAGLPVAVAGGVALVCGALGLVAGPVITIIGLAGLAAITIAGGLLGHRAAEAVPDEAELPAGCQGCQCGGCELVRPAGRSVGTDVSRMRRE
ncbi:MAG TPA: SdpI family protein [Actinophytocola sp.]|nr:SdpI family protein [Actinophytocola sp.]